VNLTGTCVPPARTGHTGGVRRQRNRAQGAKVTATPLGPLLQLAVIRRRTLIEKTITETEAAVAVQNAGLGSPSAPVWLPMRCRSWRPSILYDDL